jgi:solute carrier family 25 2-oxodicarboxylate transporter 21
VRPCQIPLAITLPPTRFLALYKGIVPKIMRLGPGGAIMLLVYESMHDYLTARSTPGTEEY